MATGTCRKVGIASHVMYRLPTPTAPTAIKVIFFLSDTGKIFIYYLL